MINTSAVLDSFVLLAKTLIWRAALAMHVAKD
jgi:hypothetical protein